MGRVSLAKYGFVRTPKKDFTYEGERYYQSKAIFNNCEIRSSMCNHRNGYVARNFSSRKLMVRACQMWIAPPGICGMPLKTKQI